MIDVSSERKTVDNSGQQNNKVLSLLLLKWRKSSDWDLIESCIPYIYMIHPPAQVIFNNKRHRVKDKIISPRKTDKAMDSWPKEEEVTTRSLWSQTDR